MRTLLLHGRIQLLLNAALHAGTKVVLLKPAASHRSTQNDEVSEQPRWHQAALHHDVAVQNAAFSSTLWYDGAILAHD